MPGRRRNTLTAAERERIVQQRRDELTELHARLGDRVDAEFSGADWRQYLDTAARFHAYSPRNLWLIMLQRPDATRVAAMRDWNKLGRRVRKGEHGIRVLAPMTRRLSPESRDPDRADGSTQPDDRDGETSTGDAGPRPRVISGFKPVSVFDISQTEGTPLPERPHPEPLTGDVAEGLWDRFAWVVAAQGWQLERGDTGPAFGWTEFSTRTIRVREGLEPAQAVKTLAHEMGHMFLRHDHAGLHRGIAEVEAESVAYVVLGAHGVDTSGYTLPYVSGWGYAADESPGDAVRRTADRVVVAAQNVLLRPGEDGYDRARTSLTRLVDRATQAHRATAELAARAETAARTAASGVETSEPSRASAAAAETALGDGAPGLAVEQPEPSAETMLLSASFPSSAVAVGSDPGVGGAAGEQLSLLDVAAVRSRGTPEHGLTR